MYDALLAKLDPASMMEVGGLGKARIAINLLCKASESEPAAAAGGIAAVADGVKVLMQTALLHPEPSLREGAVSVLACCCACNDESFIASALGGGPASLPAALVRLCAEQDRKAKPETEGDEAIDPDLPARRSAVVCLHSLLLGTDGAVAIRALRDWSGVAGTPWALLRNSDATIRERAAALLRGLLVTPAEADAATPEQRERAGLVLAFAGDAPDKVAASVTAALGDADPGVRAAGLEALAALRAARADDRKLREALENAGAETALGDAAADYGEWIRGA